jgi:cellobiose phosphorylase
VLVDGARRAFAGFALADIPLKALPRSLTQDAAPLASHAMSEDELGKRYPTRLHEERIDGRLLSFFVPDGAHNRHVVLAAKEAIVARRHGAILRSGQSMLPDESTLCATCWMHGVFAAQLTIGNTSLHKLFSVSRDPYNITRGSGLRMLVNTGSGWRLLAVPSLFEIGLSDCRWIYRLEDHTIVVEVSASGDDPAMQWRVVVDGSPCRFLIFGHLVLGEREFEQSGSISIDGTAKRFTFRSDPGWLWGKRYPEAAYYLITSTPKGIDAVGGDELLYAEGSGSGAYAVLRTLPVNEFRFAVTGSLTSSAEGKRLANKYERNVGNAEMLAPATEFWLHVTRGLRLDRQRADAGSFDTIFPWLAQNAIIHLTVPHGLEQYTGAAWGTRDVCQGPLEFFLALEHDEPVKEMLRKIFAQQYENRGDWPQWFMLEPYSNIQDAHAHGDVVIWPLKALCDYVEATNDFAFLDEPALWRDEESFARTARSDPIIVHAAKLIDAACAMFIPGTHLLRYGEGDWNDSLQPADPKMRDWMVSSWTVALFYQQLTRYAEVLRRAGQSAGSKQCDELAARIRADVNHYLIRDGTLAGYAIFDESGGEHELLLHPSDTRTGLKYSLLPMKRSILGGLFTPDQISHHRHIIREHLLFPDGARLMDRPVAYHGGREEVFRRAESSAFFGREIGLMYTHSHLRYAEAMALLGDKAAFWDALLKVNPIAVTERLGNASLRQRNTYFSSSDAAFPDRYKASSEWDRVGSRTIAVDGGWRIYSSGPGIYVNMLIRHVLGRRRYFGESVTAPLQSDDRMENR